MIKPVYNALNQLLTFKGWTTVPELTKVSGVKAIKVLTVLNDNKDLFILLKKTGRIIGFADVASKQREKLIHEGAVYVPGQTAYGEYKTLDYFGKTDSALFDRLLCAVNSGFFSGNYQQRVILDTPENRALLGQHSIRDINTIRFRTLEQMWVE
jgi:hypothetical protein